MNEQKRRIGFKTSVTDIQDDFNKVHKLLESKSFEWRKLRRLASSSVTKETEELWNKWESFRDEHLVILQAGRINHWRLIDITAQLGIAITDIRKQMNNIEKDIKDLKLHIK